MSVSQSISQPTFQVVPLDAEDPSAPKAYQSNSLELYELVAEEQFVLWVLRNWLRGTSRWSRLRAGVSGYLGDKDSPDALRAFGDIMLCLKYNGRRAFVPGAPGCPVTPDELAFMTLIAAHQNEDRQLVEGLTTWLVRPSAQQVLVVSAAKFAKSLQTHGLQLPSRVLTNPIEFRGAV